MNPQPNVTVFPGTPGQAASFDVDLVARIGAATALEGRIVNQARLLSQGRLLYCLERSPVCFPRWCAG